MLAVEFAETIDQSEYFTQGVQSCFRFEHLSLARLMHKTSYSVFGHIDFFSVLQALMVSLGGSLAEDWVMRHSELARVSNPMTHSLSFVVLIGKREGDSESQDLIFKVHLAMWVYRLSPLVSSRSKPCPLFARHY